MRCPILICTLALAGCFPSDPVDFNSEIRPILNEKCVTCHGGVRRRAELSLQFRDDALRGGKSGDPAIVPGDPGASQMVRLITHSDPGERMPLDEPALSEDDVSRVRRWIEEGAEWATHWAYEPPAAQQVPDIGGTGSPIDAFVRARLDQERLNPSPEADCRVLARRSSLDLIGLPAGPERVDELCGQPLSDETWSGYVDELLSAPGFGERWASFWLDLARYADSKGYEADRHREIWRYRDWVIEAFNRDMPFDQFTIEQLAGDLLPEPSHEQLIATAFHRNAMTNEEGGTDDEEHRIAAVIDRVNTTWEVWQGTTMACAQCHGHPYDPFTQEDYYASFSVFNNTADWDQPSEEPVLFEYENEEAGAAVERELKEIDARIQTLLATPASQSAQADWEASLSDPRVAGRLSTTVQNEVLRIARMPSEDRSPHQKAFIRDRFADVHPSTADFRGERREISQRQRELATVSTPIVRELPPSRARVTRLLERGNFLTQGDTILASTPASLPGSLFRDDVVAPEAPRLAFARWLVSDENPLTARVMVNRIWAALFGTGIVLTAEDFGTVGEPPSHPELLDWLATTFRTDMRWSIKSLLREIALSDTYRQSSVFADERDPDNLLLTRGPRVRLTGEQIRDQALAVAGLLSSRQLGPSVMPPQPDGIWRNPYNGSEWQTSEGEDRHRRAVYTYWRRTAPYPSLTTFDGPTREFCVSRRIRTNTPLQALVTLNDPVFWEASEHLAARMASAGNDTAAQLRAGYRMALARDPSPEKLAALESLVADGDTSLVLSANVILNLDEFLTRE